MKKTKWFGLLTMILAFMIAMPSFAMASAKSGKKDDDIIGQQGFLDVYLPGDYCNISVSYTVDGKTYNDSVKYGHNSMNSTLTRYAIFYDKSLQSRDSIQASEATITIEPKDGYENNLLVNGKVWKTGTIADGWNDIVDYPLPEPTITNNSIQYTIKEPDHIYDLYVCSGKASAEEQTKTGNLNLSLPDGYSLDRISHETIAYGDLVDVLINCPADFADTVFWSSGKYNLVETGTECEIVCDGYFTWENKMLYSVIINGSPDKAALGLKITEKEKKPEWATDTITVGKNITLKASKKITKWESSDPSIVSVKKSGKKKGKITGNSTGIATITAYSGKGNKQKVVKTWTIAVD